MPFPGATTTFSVQRKSVNTSGLNPVFGGQTIVATGVSITIHDLQGMIADSRGALVFNGEFKGSCSLSEVVQIGDLLLDENNNFPDGTPLAYQVQGQFLGIMAMKLHLKQTRVGI